jgi:hypothetical protein
MFSRPPSRRPGGQLGTRRGLCVEGHGQLQCGICQCRWKGEKRVVLHLLPTPLPKSPTYTLWTHVNVPLAARESHDRLDGGGVAAVGVVR